MCTGVLPQTSYSSLLLLTLQVYARTAFDLLGDRVKSWLTFNEPSVFIGGYRGTGFAPGVPTDQAVG